MGREFDDELAGEPGLVRAGERRRYRFQLATTTAFAAVWVLVYVLSGYWFFLVLAGGFLLLGGLAAGALRVLRRRDSSDRRR